MRPEAVADMKSCAKCGGQTFVVEEDGRIVCAHHRCNALFGKLSATTEIGKFIDYAQVFDAQPHIFPSTDPKAVPANPPTPPDQPAWLYPDLTIKPVVVK